MRVRASMCSNGNVRVRIRTHRIYIVGVAGVGNCGNDDDGSVRLESEMLPGARDACPNPLKLLGGPLRLFATPEALAPKRSCQWCFHLRVLWIMTSCTFRINSVF